MTRHHIAFFVLATACSAEATPGGGATEDGAESETGSTGPADDMVAVPRGTLNMGCHPDWPGACPADQLPLHEVTISGFEIDRLEVSQADYAICVSRGACTEPGTNDPEDNLKLCNWGEAGRDENPANCVTREQAEDFCAFRGARLPTEAEWERAARGDGNARYPWGDTEPTCEKAITALQEDCSGGQTADVGGRPDGASPFGAQDMVGNVREFVSDWYSADYYAASPTSDPPGPETGDPDLFSNEPMIVMRGGTWVDAIASELTVARRGRLVFGAGDHTTGIRCARDEI